MAVYESEYIYILWCLFYMNRSIWMGWFLKLIPVLGYSPPRGPEVIALVLVNSSLPQNALGRDCNGIDWIEGHYLEVVVEVYNSQQPGYVFCV